MMKLLLSAFAILTLSLAGCKSWRTDYTGTYKGKKFTFQSREIKGFSTNHFEWRIQYAGHQPVYLDATTMDWGPPYTTDIYGAQAFLVKNDTIRYANDSIQSGKSFTFSSMLYIPFSNHEDVAGNDYFELMNDKWVLFDSLFQQWQQSRMPVMLGIVQGVSFPKLSTIND